nr:MAG TPA: hypothetical protein [Caudoviricetes sp.]
MCNFDRVTHPITRLPKVQEIREIFLYSTHGR